MLGMSSHPPYPGSKQPTAWEQPAFFPRLNLPPPPPQHPNKPQPHGYTAGALPTINSFSFQLPDTALPPPPPPPPARSPFYLNIEPMVQAGQSASQPAVSSPPEKDTAMTHANMQQQHNQQQLDPQQQQHNQQQQQQQHSQQMLDPQQQQNHQHQQAQNHQQLESQQNQQDQVAHKQHQQWHGMYEQHYQQSDQRHNHVQDSNTPLQQQDQPGNMSSKHMNTSAEQGFGKTYRNMEAALRDKIAPETNNYHSEQAMKEPSTTALLGVDKMHNTPPYNTPEKPASYDQAPFAVHDDRLIFSPESSDQSKDKPKRNASCPPGQNMNTISTGQWILPAAQQTTPEKRPAQRDEENNNYQLTDLNTMQIISPKSSSGYTQHCASTNTHPSPQNVHPHHNRITKSRSSSSVTSAPIKRREHCSQPTRTSQHATSIASSETYNQFMVRTQAPTFSTPTTSASTSLGHANRKRNQPTTVSSSYHTPQTSHVSPQHPPRHAVPSYPSSGYYGPPPLQNHPSMNHPQNLRTWNPNVYPLPNVQQAFNKGVVDPHFPYHASYHHNQNFPTQNAEKNYLGVLYAEAVKKNGDLEKQLKEMKLGFDENKNQKKDLAIKVDELQRELLALKNEKKEEVEKQRKFSEDFEKQTKEKEELVHKVAILEMKREKESDLTKVLEKLEKENGRMIHEIYLQRDENLNVQRDKAALHRQLEQLRCENVMLREDKGNLVLDCKGLVDLSKVLYEMAEGASVLVEDLQESDED